MDEITRSKAFEICMQLRSLGVSADCDHMNRSIKAQFKYADKTGARFVVVIGSNELERGIFTVKDMLSSTSEEVSAENLCSYIVEKLK